LSFVHIWLIKINTIWCFFFYQFYVSIEKASLGLGILVFFKKRDLHQKLQHFGTCKFSWKYQRLQHQIHLVTFRILSYRTMYNFFILLIYPQYCKNTTCPIYVFCIHGIQPTLFVCVMSFHSHTTLSKYEACMASFGILSIMHIDEWIKTYLVHHANKWIEASLRL
jgi:hypothetical protein